MGEKKFYVPNKQQLNVTKPGGARKILQGGASVLMDEDVAMRLVVQGLLLTPEMHGAQVAADEGIRLAEEAVENARADAAAVRQAAFRMANGGGSVDGGEPVKIDTADASAKMKAQQEADAAIQADNDQQSAQRKVAKNKA